MAEASVEVDRVVYARRHDYAVAVHLESGGSVSLPSVVLFGPSASDSMPLKELGHKAFQGSEIRSIIISRTVEIISCECFADCEDLTSVAFEANSMLRRIESGAFSFCRALTEIIVPRRVEFLGENCFSACSSLSAIVFEADSSLKRIEAGAFAACSGLGQVVIPRRVAFLDGGAFSNLQGIVIVIEEGNQNFCVAEDFVLTSDRTQLVRYFGPSSDIALPPNIIIIGPGCFSNCKSLTAVAFGREIRRIEAFAFQWCSLLQTIVVPKSVEFLGRGCFALCSALSSIVFEPDSRLQRIEPGVFSHCFLLQDIVIPRRVESIGEQCFSSCKSLADVTFEPDSALGRIEAAAFAKTVLKSINLPSTISFIAANAFPPATDLTDADGSPEFADWLRRRRVDADLHFQRKPRPRRIELSTLTYVRVIKDGPISVKLYRDDSSSIVAVKWYPPVDAAKQDLFMREVKALAEVSHPCIIPLFGYAFRDGPKLLTPFMAWGSLRDAFLGRRRMWDGTAKSITAIGIVRGMIELHDAGIVHRELTAGNVLFDDERRPHIADFGLGDGPSLSRILVGTGVAPLHWAPEFYAHCGPKVDVYAFALLLYEIVVGRPVFAGHIRLVDWASRMVGGVRNVIPEYVEPFVRSVIERGWRTDPAERPSFVEIYEQMRLNDFCIVKDRFRPEDVESCVRWVDNGRVDVEPALPADATAQPPSDPQCGVA
jgi:serine/threonine protein kinase